MIICWILAQTRICCSFQIAGALLEVVITEITAEVTPSYGGPVTTAKENCVFTGAECWQCPLGCVQRERKGQAARKKIARQILAKAALGRVSQQDAPSPNPLLVLSIQCYLCLQLARALCRSRSPGTSCHPSRGLQVDGEQQRVQGEHRRERGLLALGATRVLSGGKKKKKLIDGVVAQSPCSDSVTYASQ